MNEPQTAEHSLSRRMDSQDAILREVRDMLVVHIAVDEHSKKMEEPVAKALAEIVLLWRASKILIPALVALAVGVVASIQWCKEHLK